MQGKTKEESENQFVSNRWEGVIIVDSWFLEMSICHQATLEVVDSSVFVLPSLVYPTTACCFSSTKEIDQIASLHINQTSELFPHWIYPRFRFACCCKSLRVTFVVQGICDCGGHFYLLRLKHSCMSEVCSTSCFSGTFERVARSSSLPGIGSKALECGRSSSRQTAWFLISSVERNLLSNTFTVLPI